MQCVHNLTEARAHEQNKIRTKKTAENFCHDLQIVVHTLHNNNILRYLKMFTRQHNKDRAYKPIYKYNLYKRDSTLPKKRDKAVESTSILYTS